MFFLITCIQYVALGFLTGGTQVQMTGKVVFENEIICIVTSMYE